MNNIEFDNLIKSRLDLLKSKITPNWSKMESKIDEWEWDDGLIDDSSFDQVIASKLEKNQSAIDQQSWVNLEAKMEAKQSIGNRVIYYQLSGAAVVLLFLLLLFQLYPLKKNKISNSVIVEKEITPKNSPEDLAVVLAEKGEEEIEIKAAKIESESTTIESKRISSSSSDNENNLRDGLANVAESTMELSPGLIDNNKTKTGSYKHIESPTSITGENSNAGQNIVHFEKNGMDRFFNRILPVKSGSSLSLGIIYERDGLSGMLPLISMPLIHKTATIKSLTDNGFSVKLYANPQLVFVNSPFDPVYQETGYQRNVFTLGGGAAVAYDFKRLGISLGAEYCKIAYEPKQIQEKLSGQSTYLYLNRIEYDLLRLPLQLYADIWNNGKFKSYVYGGIALNAILNSSYEIHENRLGLAFLINDLKTNPSYKNTLLSQKDFEPGIAQGGETSKSIFADLDLGVGIEYAFNNGLSCFIEPGFHFGMNKDGVGPNNDVFNDLTIRSGFKMAIN